MEQDPLAWMRGLGIGSGLRPGELAGLRRGGVHLRRGGRVRLVLPKRVLEAALPAAGRARLRAAVRGGGGPAECLFPAPHGDGTVPVSGRALQQALRRLGSRAGVAGVTFTRLRKAGQGPGAPPSGSREVLSFRPYTYSLVGRHSERLAGGHTRGYNGPLGEGCGGWPDPASSAKAARGIVMGVPVTPQRGWAGAHATGTPLRVRLWRRSAAGRHGEQQSMNPKFMIRTETAADAEAIAEVTLAAFRTLEVSDHTEQFVIDALRAAKALSISLVAEADGRVVGHIAFSPVTLSDGTMDWYGLGPVSVLPEYQRRGIGSALIREGLSRLRALKARGCCLVGHPGYYTRFGFRNTAGLGHEGVPPEVFFALSFDGRMPQGTVRFHEGFAARGPHEGAGGAR